MRVFVRFFVAIAFINSSYNPAAADFSNYGQGSATCGAFIAASQGFAPGKLGHLNSHNQEYFTENLSYIQWALGFIAAIPYRDANTNSVIKDVSSFDLWLRNWCNAHPTDFFADAVVAFLRSEGVIK
jgi:hypothetical protein